jgi:hypothetical protein
MIALTGPAPPEGGETAIVVVAVVSAANSNGSLPRFVCMGILSSVLHFQVSSAPYPLWIAGTDLPSFLSPKSSGYSAVQRMIL